MKILFVTPYLGPVYGGPSQSVIALARELGKLKINLDIVSTNANGRENLDVPTKRWIEKDGYRIQYFPRLRVPNYVMSPALSKWLKSGVRAYDLVHTNTVFSYPMLAAHRACRALKIPYIRTPRGMLEPWALSYKAWKKKYYYTLIEKPSFQAASAIQAIAAPEARNLKSLGLAPPISVIPNGICQQEFQHLRDPEEFYRAFPKTRSQQLILFLGRIDPKKGLDMLAKAFARVAHDFPKSMLVIAGPDTAGYLTKVKKDFADCNHLHRVVFTGMISGSLKKSALSAAFLFVVPSYSEGFSMSVLEGMASGLPTIITDKCNFPEAGQAKVALVVKCHWEALSDAMAKCLHNPDFARELGQKGRNFIFEHYTWVHASKKLAKLYETILNHGNPNDLDFSLKK